MRESKRGNRERKKEGKREQVRTQGEKEKETERTGARETNTRVNGATLLIDHLPPAGGTHT